MGVTGHVLNADLKRKSFALACRFFPGTHTYDRVAKLLSDIHDEYNLPVDKLTCCVSDNGSSFVNAFKKFEVVVELAHDSDDDEDADAADDNEQIDVDELMPKE